MAILCEKHIVEALWDCADCPASGPRLHLQVIDYSLRQPAIDMWEHYNRRCTHCNVIDPLSHSTKGYRNRVWGNWQSCGVQAVSGRGSFIRGRCCLLFSRLKVIMWRTSNDCSADLYFDGNHLQWRQSNVCRNSLFFSSRRIVKKYSHEF